MTHANAKLVEPTVELKEKFLAMAQDFLNAGEERYKSALADFSAYFQKVSDYAAGTNLEPDKVQENEFWLVDKDMVVGRSKLRHRLTPALEREGGHIGYDVRPSERRKGYGALILKLTLERARGLGLEKVLITCDTDNIGSAKIIEKNGGMFAKHDISEKTGKQISQYWITI